MKRMGYCGIKLQLAVGNLQHLQHFSPLICKNAFVGPSPGNWGGTGGNQQNARNNENVQKFGVNIRFEIVAKQSHETPNTLAASSLWLHIYSMCVCECVPVYVCSVV